MAKSADAFRTISEVAEWLGSPAHVLRFWESKFSQVKPVKRAGGRRYYRPADMLLLGGIKKLLHDDGMTIKGVQKILREQGVKHVSELSAPIDDETGETPSIDSTLSDAPEAPLDQTVASQVLRFEREDTIDSAKTAAEAAQTVTAPEPITTERSTPSETLVSPPVAGSPRETDGVDDGADDFVKPETPAAPVDAPAAGVEHIEEPSEESVEGTPASDSTMLEDFVTPDRPGFVSERSEETPESTRTEAVENADNKAAPTETSPPRDESSENRLTNIPAFLTRPSPEAMSNEGGKTTSETDESHALRDAVDEPPPPPRPAIVDLPPDPSDDDALDTAPGLLAAIAARGRRPLPASARTAAFVQRDKLLALVNRHDRSMRE